MSKTSKLTDGMKHHTSQLFTVAVHIFGYREWLVIKYALINRARGPYEEIFVLTFKAYEPNAVRFMRLECKNKYFLYGPKSRLIRALLYTYTNNTVYDEILLT